MDSLWAPWRINYIQGKKEKGCIFCNASRKKGKKDFVVFTQPHSLCMLNIYPYNNGHLMIAPRRHVKDLSLLNREESLDLFASIQRAKKLLESVLKPQGFNIGINIGEAAGAGIPGHIHVHIVPRWKGDTNFMPVTAHTKVISQSLHELHKRLTHAYSKPD